MFPSKVKLSEVRRFYRVEFESERFRRCFVSVNQTECVTDTSSSHPLLISNVWFKMISLKIMNSVIK